MATSGRWPEVSSLLDELLELDAEARPARLAELRGTDPELAGEVEALLARGDTVERGGFLEGSALDLSGAALEGTQLGSYTLEKLIGQGGMGAVWLARRSDGRFEGKAAVKLLDLGLLARGGAERFRREGTILARLAHPNIARLLDAGISGSRPFLVLEYVEGEPIDAWCEARALDVPARLRLFLGVLDAVVHAHDRLVLHRDLKPSNILVTAQGQPKLLDFGIAKLLEEDTPAAPATELTRLAGRAFTPAYAAPEQVEGGDATTATDVYALGVVLFGLLSGTHPTTAPGASTVAELRAVVEREPLRLGDAALRAGPDAALRRGATPAQLARALRGDLDNILARALRKAPSERYPTVHALAEDLRRHLAHEPVSARPDAFSYRLGKAMRRHRLAFAAAGAVLLALVAGVVATTWQAIEARRQRAEAILQRDRAQRLFARNEAVADFVETTFADAVPAGKAAALQEMLDAGASLVEGSLEEPEFRAEVLNVLGRYYLALENPKKAAPVLERAAALAGEDGDPSLRAVIACSRAQALLTLGDKDGAGRLLAPWLDDAAVNGNVAAYCLAAAAMLGETNLDPPAILEYAERGLARVRASPFPSRRIEASLLGDQGLALHYLGREQEADAAYGNALVAFRSLGRQESADALRVTGDWANALWDAGDARGALQLREQALRVEERRRGAEVPPLVLGSYAFSLEDLGRLPEALAAYDATRSASERVGSAPGVVYAWIGRASVLEQQGAVDEAEAALRRASALVGNALPEAHPALLRRAAVQARIDVRRGKLEEARARLTRLLELLTARGLSHPSLVNAHCRRAEVSLARGDVPGALSDATEALELATTLQGGRTYSAHTGRAWLALGKVLLAGGKPAEARDAFARAREQLAGALGAEGPDAEEAARLLVRTAPVAGSSPAVTQAPPRAAAQR
jgi:serine/threonine protein kinase/tetratricopeptide (TPR) repeat protein